MPTLEDWSPRENFVQSGVAPDGRFMSARDFLIAAGPPSLEALGASAGAGTILAETGASQLAYPIGMISGFNFGHNKQFARLFEIGSDRSYFLSGRSVGQATIQRPMYYGPNLLRMLTAYYQDLALPTPVLPMFPNVGLANMQNPHDVKVAPGYENIFLNLGSDLFDQPMGILVYVKDSNEDTMGACYLEYCYIPNHGFGTDAQGVIVQESASIQFERMVPVAVSGVGLITGGLSDVM
jgi:hypothetical protein